MRTRLSDHVRLRLALWSLVGIGMSAVLLVIGLVSWRTQNVRVMDRSDAVSQRNYDMQVSVVLEPVSIVGELEPKRPSAPPPSRQSHVVADREFVCGPMNGLEQGNGAVRRCEWVIKKR